MNSEKEKILKQSVQFIKSVGPKRAEAFGKIGINTIRDLLFYFPSRHLDRTTTLNVSKAYGFLIDGFNGEITIVGKVVEKEKLNFGRKELLKVQMRDSTGFFECVWFQGIKYFSNVFNIGEIFAVSGKPVISKYNALQFTHPDFDRITEDESNSLLNTGKIIPFYRIPKELRVGNIGDFSLRKIINTAVENYAGNLDETLPEELLKENNIAGLVDSIKNFHFPESKEKLNTAIQRFKFEELFYLEILVALRKFNYKTKLSGNSMRVKTNLISSFLKILPFKLTEAQLRALSEIRKDMESPLPMNRLLQGDVGSGKTIVALIAMLIAVDNGFQAVLMAPTEILADQHAKNISILLKNLSGICKEKEIKLSLLIGGQKKSVKEKNLVDIEFNEADIVIGTHALFEEKVKFQNLGLVIVDEQHRFGVEQRGKLQNKGIMPDVLVMSATPIPRTLTMTVYGDLDVSIINEMPKERKPIKTIMRGENSLPDIYQYIVDKVKDGYQSFIVYPLVEESEKLELKAAETYYKKLTETFLKEINVGLLHGRMSWQEKEEVMLMFLAKKYDALIATTVIEVGIDIPDANIIVINDAQRFGLSQLHQLRGRIGRGTKQGYCILVTKEEFAASRSKYKLNLDYLSPVQLEKYRSTVRLQTMVNFLDGFKIAEIDLKLRGPGNIFGTEQSGFPELKHADLINDTQLIIRAKTAAFALIENDPHFQKENHFIIKKNLLEHYSHSLNYAKIA
ncbi:MAG TPA: ATP-dependent DNA helicase RecG [Ignavibacteriaceae bacterium]|nr:ATP-dependent DNA helicase RecG [Ignavibacteriaceae bacterium]